jgi:hypothetical protein
MYPNGIFPSDYANAGGREVLAETIFTALPDLRSKAREPIRPGILIALPELQRNMREPIRQIVLQLVGAETAKLAEQRIGVPVDARPDEQELARRHEVIDRHMRLGYHEGAGCIVNLYRFCARDHYPALRGDYGELGLLWLAQGGPHAAMRSDVQAEAFRLLQSILDHVTPRRSRALPGRRPRQLAPGSA